MGTGRIVGVLLLAAVAAAAGPLAVFLGGPGGGIPLIDRMTAAGVHITAERTPTPGPPCAGGQCVRPPGCPSPASLRVEVTARSQSATDEVPMLQAHMGVPLRVIGGERVAGTGFVVAQADPSVILVRAVFPGGYADEMAPVDGAAVLAGPAGSVTVQAVGPGGDVVGMATFGEGGTDWVGCSP